ncbi:precorrin-3B synthase [Bosea sp. TND4EK4]|uniref:precorrin-3B synthase n=1 Tax=Bosea sp. TND4EK4 TaxID=1907408 RepID=UPI0009569392|nr:precorrin-3B synthase [Bosea sp. TND4EK4]SIQ85634.1 precorrin-3B synthase [Bosea sp. TND4EK4]
MSEAARDAMRRGWCPSTLKPMETGDGWLVRLYPPGARLTPQQLGRIAALALAHGNGLVEISARASLQLRGVTALSHPRLVDDLLAEGLLDEPDRDGPKRITLVSPLAGLPRLDAVLPIDAFALAERIEAAARTIEGLPPKCTVIVDDGGPSSLDGIAGDIRLVGAGGGRIVLSLADGPCYGPLAEGEAPDLVAAILRRFAALRRAAPERIRRLRDLPADALSGLVDLPDAAAPAPRPAPRCAGLFSQSDGRVTALIALPFGRSRAEMLAALAQAVRDEPAEIRPSPWRGLAFRGLSPAAAGALLARAQAQGLIVDDSDPRLSVQACAGSPACTRAQAPAAADADRLAGTLAALLREGLDLHVSGCAKGCAHPAAADLTLTGRDGRYEVVMEGRAGDAPLATLDLPALLARLQPGQDWHARLEARGTRRNR